MPIVAGAGDVDRRHLAVLLVLVVETLAHRRVARACREAAHEHAARLAGHGRRRRGAAARLARHRRVAGGTVRRRPARRRPTTAAGTAAAAQPGVLSCRSTLYCRLASLAAAAAAAAVTTTPHTHTHTHALATTNKHTFTLTTKPFDSELHFFFLVIISHPEQWSLQ